jgi:hypothetical protein
VTLVGRHGRSSGENTRHRSLPEKSSQIHTSDKHHHTADIPGSLQNQQGLHREARRGKSTSQFG